MTAERRYEPNLFASETILREQGHKLEKLLRDRVLLRVFFCTLETNDSRETQIRPALLVSARR
jgi:hypothetical protein